MLFHIFLYTINYIVFACCVLFIVPSSRLALLPIQARALGRAALPFAGTLFLTQRMIGGASQLAEETHTACLRRGFLVCRREALKLCYSEPGTYRYPEDNSKAEGVAEAAEALKLHAVA